MIKRKEISSITRRGEAPKVGQATGKSGGRLLDTNGRSLAGGELAST